MVVNNSLTPCWPFVIIITIKCVQLVRMCSSRIVRHLIDQRDKPITQGNMIVEILVSASWNVQMVEHVEDWHAQCSGLWTWQERSANSKFCQTKYRYCGLYLHLCSCVICQCLNMCKNNPHMFHFELFALFWYCNTSNGAQRTRGESTLESSTERLSAHYGKREQRNSVLHFLGEQNSLSLV